MIRNMEKYLKMIFGNEIIGDDVRDPKTRWMMVFKDGNKYREFEKRLDEKATWCAKAGHYIGGQLEILHQLTIHHKGTLVHNLGTPRVDNTGIEPSDQARISSLLSGLIKELSELENTLRMFEHTFREKTAVNFEEYGRKVLEAYVFLRKPKHELEDAFGLLIPKYKETIEAYKKVEADLIRLEAELKHL